MIKKINYFLIRLLYPKPNKIISLKSKNVKKVSINKFKYKIYKVKNCRLYTDTINNFAVIKDNFLIKNCSYQLKNGNNSNIKKNIVLKIGTPRKKFIFNNNVFSLLSGGGANNNYFHWLFDVLPKINIVKKYINIKKIDFFLFPNLSQKFQIETLNLLKIPKKKLLSSIKFRHIESKEIYTTSHPYISTKNSHKDAQNIPLWISIWLKRNFLQFNSNKYRFKKIFIDRRQQKFLKHGRSIINNEEIKNFLKKNGFVSLFLEDFTFKDQISIFNNAKIIVGLHGAAFANLVFCKSRTQIIELKTKTTGKQIENLAKQNHLKYNCVIGGTKKKTYYQQGHIEIPLNLLKKKLRIT